MKIVILGAGQVGSSVAQGLVNEQNVITMVDRDPLLLAALQDRLDIRVVAGEASHPEILLSAGIEDADLILAVTNSDETNMIACQVAYSLYRTPMRLARVRAAGYLLHPELFVTDGIPIDFLISPEALVTDFVRQLIEYPGTLQILEFGDGRAQLVAVRVQSGASLARKALRDLHTIPSHVEIRVVAIYRLGAAVAPDADAVIEADDEVFFLAARRDVPQLVNAFRRPERANRRVIIAGGGNIGARLAQQIEHAYRVKIIEHDGVRARQLAESLHHTIVLRGDAADETLLIDEGIADTDVFCALTNDDEANILSAMLAKQLGALRAISIVNRPSYVDIAQGAAVDIAVSPAQVTIGALLTHVRRGDVVAVHALRRGAAEAIEIIAHGDKDTSQVVGRCIADIALPPSAVVGGLLRGEQLLLAHGETVIEPQDHVIVFLADKRQVAEVERLFRVSITFV